MSKNLRLFYDFFYPIFSLYFFKVFKISKILRYIIFINILILQISTIFTGKILVNSQKELNGKFKYNFYLKKKTMKFLSKRGEANTGKPCF